MKPKKLKFENVKQVRRNMFERQSWIKCKTKKKDLKCTNCNVLYETLDTDIAFMAITGKTNQHVCDECAKRYINEGAEDIYKKIKAQEEVKAAVIKEIEQIGTWKPTYYDKKKLSDYNIDELTAILDKLTLAKEKKDRINSIKISNDDAIMEDYLKEDYNVIQDVKWLKCEEQIKGYFEDEGHEFFDCGQGYYQDEASAIIKIAQKFYEVSLYAEIGSAKQDRGDRLYWVEAITKIEWKEIDKPLPKSKSKISYTMELSNDQRKEVDELLSKFNPTIDEL